MNPRYQAFMKAHGKQPNYVYVAFISDMKTAYEKSLNEPQAAYFRIRDHDDFTKFIEANASDFDPKEGYPWEK